MTRDTFARDLEEAECTVQLATDHLSAQRELVARLNARGRDIRAAVVLLRTFEQSFMLHIAKRNRLRDELAQYGEGP